LVAVAAPVVLAGMLVGGSSGFQHTAVKSMDPVGLNQLSDTINFSGVLTQGRGTFAVNSTSCTLVDGGEIPGQPVSIPCHLHEAGHITSSETPVTTATVLITSADGTITFQETGSGGCSSGTGNEFDNGAIIPIRAEGTSSTGEPTSPTSFPIWGQFKVYEAGGGGDIGLCLTF
jgi:hypothetical protein